jgi:hypothetical protein
LRELDIIRVTATKDAYLGKSAWVGEQSDRGLESGPGGRLVLADIMARATITVSDTGGARLSEKLKDGTKQTMGESHGGD